MDRTDPLDLPAEGADPLVALASMQDGVLTADQCLAAGMSRNKITACCRSGAWCSVFRGVYYVRQRHGQVPPRARIRAALLSLGPAATATLTSAAQLHELPFTPVDDCVHAAVPAAANRVDQPGLLVRQLVVPETDRVTLDGMAVTSRSRTLADLVLRLPRFDAVAMLDGALHSGRISEDEVALMLTQLRRRRGAVRARRRVSEADGRAASPLETRTRLVCSDGGVPPEEVQFPVRDEQGHLLAVADLAWPSRKVIVEVDGRLVHAAPGALYHDRRRQNELAARGWTVVRFTWADLARPGYVVSAVRRALVAAGRPRPVR